LNRTQVNAHHLHSIFFSLKVWIGIGLKKYQRKLPYFTKAFIVFGVVLSMMRKFAFVKLIPTKI